MSRWRHKRRAEKTRRHHDPPPPNEPAPRPTAQWPTEPPTAESPPQVVVRKASHVDRLAYTRSQAAEALGISRTTLRRLLPYLETIELPWGTSLIPVDELERLAAERRRAAPDRRPAVRPGRKPRIPPAVVDRIRAARAAGESLREIAASLNDDRTPTAHGGANWWPSTVRAVLSRSSQRTD